MYVVGDVVKVRTYYDDLIPKGIFVGLITGIRNYPSSRDLDHLADITIYDLLDLDTSEIKSAEGFAILGIVEEEQ